MVAAYEFSFDTPSIWGAKQKVNILTAVRGQNMLGGDGNFL